MRKRAGFGSTRLIVVGAAVAVTALLPATASAVTTVYHPTQDARTFKKTKGNWTGTATYGGGCVAGATCPGIVNSFQSGGGAGGPSDGFLRSRLDGILATVLGTSNAIWESPKFAYAGAGGATPNSVVFTLASQSAVGGLIGVGGSVEYSVRLVDVTNGAGSRTLIGPVAVNTAPGWNGVVPVAVSPSELTLGHEYRLRISTSYASALAVIPDATVDYDNVALVAERPGGGAGAGGGPAGGGLASKRAVMKGDKLRVKVRCGAAVQGRCKTKLVGLWKKAGPRVTKLRKVFVRAGKTKKVSLKMRPRAIAAVATRDKIWVAIKVNANGYKTLVVKKLKLIVR
jgi:hypothetical protein